VFHARVPWVREVNVVRVEATAPRVRAGEIAFAAEERFPAAPAVEVLHEPIGAALAPAFAAAGWQVSRHLLMALEDHPPELPPIKPTSRIKPAPPAHAGQASAHAGQAVAVEEVSPEAVWPLREEWMRSEPWGTDDAVAAMLRWERWRAGLTGARAFCAFDGGRAASTCMLLATPHADEIERVYTTPSRRGRGLAYAVVARAAREAGDQLTFLFTDAHGAAQHLYARLGFRRAWTVYRFLRNSRSPGGRLPSERQ
jgi:GNAT superfamily N-acetyltransferase